MKKYIKPEIDVKLFEIEDIITTSGVGGDSTNYRMLKTSVNGNEGTDYGRQNVSVFE